MNISQEVIFTTSAAELDTDRFSNYLAHAFCLGGYCEFRFNDKIFTFSAGDLMIVCKGWLVENIRCSDDFKVMTIYATPGFIEHSTPKSNYGMTGELALFVNPVMRLTPEMQRVCKADFEDMRRRLSNCRNSKFYHEIIRAKMEMLILDFFDFHTRLYDTNLISRQSATLMSRFLDLLEAGEFYKNREVAHYADCLCVSPKYLSEVSKKVSGYPATYWINRYTTLEISRKLRDKELSFNEISDMFRFSSPSYFTRYVQQHLGMSPSDYRE